MGREVKRRARSSVRLVFAHPPPCALSLSLSLSLSHSHTHTHLLVHPGRRLHQGRHGRRHTGVPVGERARRRGRRRRRHRRSSRAPTAHSSFQAVRHDFQAVYGGFQAGGGAAHAEDHLGFVKERESLRERERQTGKWGDRVALHFSPRCGFLLLLPFSPPHPHSMLALRGAGPVPAARGVRSGRRGQVGPVPARRTAPRLVVRREQKREENRLQNRAGSLPFWGGAAWSVGAWRASAASTRPIET